MWDECLSAVTVSLQCKTSRWFIAFIKEVVKWDPIQFWFHNSVMWRSHTNEHLVTYFFADSLAWSLWKLGDVISQCSSCSCGDEGTTALAGHVGPSGLGWCQFSYPTAGGTLISFPSCTKIREIKTHTLESSILANDFRGFSPWSCAPLFWGSASRKRAHLMGWHYLHPGDQETDRGRHCR